MKGKEYQLSEDSKFSEKRAHPRYPMLVVGEARHLALAGSGMIRIVASNISMGGIVVNTDPMGEIVESGDVLKLIFPMLHQPPVELQARVVWKRKGAEPGIGEYSFGMMFFNAEENEVKRLHDPARSAFISGLGPETYKD